MDNVDKLLKLHSSIEWIKEVIERTEKDCDMAPENKEHSLEIQKKQCLEWKVEYVITLKAIIAQGTS